VDDASTVVERLTAETVTTFGSWCHGKMGTPGPWDPTFPGAWGPLCENRDPHLTDIKHIKQDRH